MSDLAGAPEEGASSSTTLESNLIFYGALSGTMLIIYSLLRNVFPKLYNVRNVVEDLNCDLAAKKYPPFFWMPAMMRVTEQEIFEQCGFDALTFVRYLKMGTQISVIGCLNAAWLIPVYQYADDHESTANVTDTLDQMTLANVPGLNPPGAYQLFGAVATAYVISFSSMALLYREFSWYIKERHQFMTRETPQNYTIYVGGVPKNLRSESALRKFFRFLFKHSIHQIHLVRKIGDLEDLMSDRDALQAKLDRDMAEFERDGERPTHFTTRGSVDSIDVHTAELLEVKRKMNTQIKLLGEKWDEHEKKCFEGDDDALQDPPDDIDDAAFVSFKSLQAATTALQLLHHETPFNMVAIEAPLPKDIYWRNIGLDHWKLQIMSIFAGFLTVALCVFWTLPVSFIATLTKVESLKARVPFLETWSNNFSLLDELLAVVAPLALIQLNNFLPIILGWFCKLEGHIGENTLQASLFSKLTMFMIIQTFFVSAIAGSLFDQIDELAKDPAGQTINILATSLPSQSVVFITYVLVKSTVGMADELLRFWVALYAGIRKLLGPNLTEDEKMQDRSFLNETFVFSPLCNPGNMDYTALFSDMILMFIILFVYAVLSPLSCFFLVFAFLCLNLAYRNQIIHIYDPSNDTGGKLWTQVAGYIVVTMLIAQVTIMGVLGLKGGNSIHVPLMVPLVVSTILFWRYLRQQHFRVANTLPIITCHAVDEKFQEEKKGYEFVTDAYKQEALFINEIEGEEGDEEGKKPADPSSPMARSVIYGGFPPNGSV
eukprot:2092716-Rhodomonas_salina.1